MSKHRAVEAVNTWWKGVPGERYWLDVTHRDRRDGVLAAPRGEGRRAASWAHRLITHVKAGDVVFRYDAAQEAIVSWSVSHGMIEKRQVSWPLPSGFNGNGASNQTLSSWGIRLRESTVVEATVPLREIAETQWSLFPSLRALEDAVGDPLYYPFEMGRRDATRPLPGYVFKLPAVFVRAFPALAGAEFRASVPEVSRTSTRAGVETFHGLRDQRTA